MNPKIILPIIAVIAAFVIISFTLPTNDEPSHKFSFSYLDANQELQSTLINSDIHMSSPLKINGLAIKKYCTFFSDEQIQKSIQYCTSTELLDSKKNFLGNIQMVGKNNSPQYVIGAIQMNSLGTQIDDIKIIINTMIEHLVCDCWAQEKPGDFESVDEWIDATYSHHLEGTGTTSKSRIDGLAELQLLMEVTTNSDGYLWKFLIS